MSTCAAYNRTQFLCCVSFALLLMEDKVVILVGSAMFR